VVLVVSPERTSRDLAHIAIYFCAALSLAACSTQTEFPPQPTLRQPTLGPAARPPTVATPETGGKRSKTVTTSYQGSGTAGQATATGEAYDPNTLTAASRNLPLGSTVRVINPKTGRSVDVRINDRPGAHGRSLDLSKSAAEKLGITDKGVARLKVTPVDSPPIPDKPESQSQKSAQASPEPDSPTH
jgi:rare lipoprotein A